MALFDKEKKIFICRCGCGTEINFWADWAPGHATQFHGPESAETCRRKAISRDRYLVSHPEYSEEQSKRLTGIVRTPEDNRINSLSKIKWYKEHPEEKGLRTAIMRAGITAETLLRIAKTLREYYKAHPDLAKSGAAFARSYIKKKGPNRPEAALGELLEQLWPGEWTYTGDRSFPIGEDPMLYPDFTNKIKFAVIESNGTYWHDAASMDPDYRLLLYKERGYKCLILSIDHENEVPLNCSEILDFIKSLEAKE